MYRTILEPSEAEVIIKKSRFICYTIPVSNELQAKEHIENVKKHHRQATHNVPVYVLGENFGVQRYSDDGEPSGTAGIPVLEMYKKAGITNICTVITRYFGGVKLGTGGLVRAYTEAAQAAIEDKLVVVDSYVEIAFHVSYHLHGKIDYIIRQHPAYVIHTDFGQDVSILLYIEASNAMTFVSELVEASAGTVAIEQKNVYGAIDHQQFVKM